MTLKRCEMVIIHLTGVISTWIFQEHWDPFWCKRNTAKSCHRWSKKFLRMETWQWGAIQPRPCPRLRHPPKQTIRCVEGAGLPNRVQKSLRNRRHAREQYELVRGSEATVYIDKISVSVSGMPMREGSLLVIVLCKLKKVYSREQTEWAIDIENRELLPIGKLTRKFVATTHHVSHISRKTKGFHIFGSCHCRRRISSKSEFPHCAIKNKN